MNRKTHVFWIVAGVVFLALLAFAGYTVMLERKNRADTGEMAINKKKGVLKLESDMSSGVFNDEALKAAREKSGNLADGYKGMVAFVRGKNEALAAWWPGVYSTETNSIIKEKFTSKFDEGRTRYEKDIPLYSETDKTDKADIVANRRLPEKFKKLGFYFSSDCGLRFKEAISTSEAKSVTEKELDGYRTVQKRMNIVKAAYDKLVNPKHGVKMLFGLNFDTGRAASPTVKKAAYKSFYFEIAFECPPSAILDIRADFEKWDYLIDIVEFSVYKIYVSEKGWISISEQSWAAGALIKDKVESVLGGEGDPKDVGFNPDPDSILIYMRGKVYDFNPGFFEDAEKTLRKFNENLGLGNEELPPVETGAAHGSD